MPGIDKKAKAGPLGRARLSHALMRRPQGDPRLRRNANLLATPRRTASGAQPVVLDYTGVVPQPVEDALRVLEARHNELVTVLIQAGLLEQTP